MKSKIKSAVLGLIRFYQQTLSPDHGWGRLALLRAGCRFYPSCSEYFYQAIGYYGLKKGLCLGLGRLSRCHPWSRGGFDLLKRN